MAGGWKPPEKRVKLDTIRPQRGVKPTTDPQQTILGFRGKRSLWDHNLATMPNGKCRTLRTELAKTIQGGEPPGDTPRDQLMDAWGTPGAEENTTAQGNNPDTRADDHIEQLQTWFTQETEKELQEATWAENFYHRQSSTQIT